MGVKCIKEKPQESEIGRRRAGGDQEALMRSHEGGGRVFRGREPVPDVPGPARRPVGLGQRERREGQSGGQAGSADRAGQGGGDGLLGNSRGS